MSTPVADLPRIVIRSESLVRTMGHFTIGTMGGLASVFLPRMMLLLSVDTEPAPQRYITVVPSDFVWLGLAFAVAVGLIYATLEHGSEQAPRAIFMTALGIPALLSGVLNTTSATNKLQRVEGQSVTLAGAPKPALNRRVAARRGRR